MCSNLQEQIEPSNAVPMYQTEARREPWPEDRQSKSTAKYTTCQSIGESARSVYNRWTYSYMNRIFQKVGILV